MFDGGNVIAEYDYNNNLLRKYIYGPREWWQPQASPEKAGRAWGWMKDIVLDNDAEYYYHRDGLGSVVALSDSNGDTVQTYEYSIYGQVAAEDPNFLTNPYLFTGRRFDIETGLYYYRARYYNPYIGRFLQTDPVGYDNGINWYVYCGNNPLGRTDPSGLAWVGDPNDPIWIQEYASSCGPATVMNALAELGIQYNDEATIRGMFEDLINLPSPRGVQIKRGYDGRIWGQELTGNGVTGTERGGNGVTMEQVKTVLNNLLQANKSSQRYEIENGGSWDLDDMKAGASKGPVIYVSSFRGLAHCQMITKVEENTYWTVNPLTSYAQMAGEGSMKDILDASFTYQNSTTNSWKVPILVLN